MLDRGPDRRRRRGGMLIGGGDAAPRAHGSRVHDWLTQAPTDGTDRTVTAFKHGLYSKCRRQAWLVSRGPASEGTFDSLVIPFRDGLSLVSKDHRGSKGDRVRENTLSSVLGEGGSVISLTLL